MFTAEKCKRDWPIGGKAASAAACVCVRIGRCSNQEVPLYCLYLRMIIFVCFSGFVFILFVGSVELFMVV